VKTLIVGDIHGCWDELNDLLELAALGADDAIISVGDLVDRGPDSPRVLAFFRDSANTVFSPGSGLAQRGSDWIIAGDAQPWKGLSFFARTRLDADTLEVHRLEAGANVNIKWGSGYVRYLSDDQGINGTPIKNLDVGGDINLTQHWGVSAYGNRDIEQNAWVIRDLGVFYKDECIRVDVFYRHEDVILGRLGSSDQLSVRLTLATLGGPIYGR
jgi:LPS-assembly protein